MMNENLRDANRLADAMRACVDNGQRLRQDAEWLAADRSPTVVALCILAQEEYAKAFLLHLVREGIIPWSPKVHKSLYNHETKQLMGLIMDWLNPPDEEFDARMWRTAGDPNFPTYAADAMKLFVKKVQPKGQIACPPTLDDINAKSIADGERDRIKQDALYVRLSEDADILSVPKQVDPEMVDAELDRTKRLGDLVRPLRDGALGAVLDYDLFVETMGFLLLDKSNRPFLILRDSEIGGPVSTPNGNNWPHSIKVSIDNIADEAATHVNGHAAVYIDNIMVKPFFIFNEFDVDAHGANLCTLFVSEEAHNCVRDPSHKLDLYIYLEYRGLTTDLTYYVRMWGTYDQSIGVFKETCTDSNKSVNGTDTTEGNVEVVKWTRPTRGRTVPLTRGGETSG